MSKATKAGNIGFQVNKITKTCHTCHKEYTFPVNSSKFLSWVRKTFVPQDGIDELFVEGVSVKDTEMQIRGTCGDCFDKVLEGKSCP